MTRWLGFWLLVCCALAGGGVVLYAACLAVVTLIGEAAEALS